MSNPAHIQSFLDDLAPVLSLVDEVLNDWKGEGCLQFPHLLGTISAKLNWNEETARQHDAIIRQFVRNHPVWFVTRGAHGGIMRRAEKLKKEAALEAKKKARAEMDAAVEAKLAAQQAAASVPVDSGSDNSNIVSE